MSLFMSRIAWVPEFQAREVEMSWSIQTRPPPPAELVQHQPSFNRI
jgi:hypothetical protein